MMYWRLKLAVQHNRVVVSAPQSTVTFGAVVRVTPPSDRLSVTSSPVISPMTVSFSTLSLGPARSPKFGLSSGSTSVPSAPSTVAVSGEQGNGLIAINLHPCASEDRAAVQSNRRRPHDLSTANLRERSAGNCPRCLRHLQRDG